MGSGASGLAVGRVPGRAEPFCQCSRAGDGEPDRWVDRPSPPAVLHFIERIGVSGGIPSRLRFFLIATVCSRPGDSSAGAVVAVSRNPSLFLLTLGCPSPRLCCNRRDRLVVASLIESCPGRRARLICDWYSSPRHGPCAFTCAIRRAGVGARCGRACRRCRRDCAHCASGRHSTFCADRPSHRLCLASHLHASCPRSKRDFLASTGGRRRCRTRVRHRITAWRCPSRSNPFSTSG